VSLITRGAGSRTQVDLLQKRPGLPPEPLLLGSFERRLKRNLQYSTSFFQAASHEQQRPQIQIMEIPLGLQFGGSP
jgi:hypothetical protein